MAHQRKKGESLIIGSQQIIRNPENSHLLHAGESWGESYHLWTVCNFFVERWWEADASPLATHLRHCVPSVHHPSSEGP